MPKLSLRSLIPLAMIGSVVPMIFALAYWNYEVEYRNLIDRYKLQGRIAMGAFYDLIEAGLVHKEHKTLNQAVNSVASFPCFSRALGIDSSRRIFLSSDSHNKGALLETVDPQLADRWPLDKGALVRLEGGGTRMAVYRKLEEAVLMQNGFRQGGGWLFLELDLRNDLAKHERAMKQQFFVYSAVVVGFSLLLWLWLSRNVTEPLVRITRAVQDFGKGGSMVLKESGSAELIALTQGITGMSSELEKRYSSLVYQRILYQALSQTNQSILHSTSERSLLINVCEAAVSAGLKLVWIGYVDKRRDSLSVVHTAGDEHDWLESVRRHVGLENDPLAEQARIGKEALIYIDQDPSPDMQWYAEARLNGFEAGACFPITRSGSHVGGLIVMSDDIALLDQDAVLLLREMAADISFALDYYDQDLERQRMEQNLSKERGMLRTLIDTIPDIIFFKDESRTYLACNRAFESLAATSENKLVGGTDQDIFPPPIAQKLSQQDERIFAQGKTERSEIAFDHPEGKQIQLDLVKAPYRGADGSIIGLVGIGRDMTAEFLARRELEQTLSILQFAERISKIGTWSYDKESRLMSWSDRMFRILDYRPEDTVPTIELLIERCHADDRQQLKSDLEALLGGESDGFEREYLFLFSDGGSRRLSGCGGRYERDGGQTMVVGTFRSVNKH